MELRFLEGNFEHGKFKLQMREYGMNDWKDVPCVQEKPKFWCEHMTYATACSMWNCSGEGWGMGVADDVNFCPICGKEKP